MRNSWIERDGYIIIKVKCKGEEFECLIDKSDFGIVDAFSGTWYGWRGLNREPYVLIKVKEDGKWTSKRMHRVIMGEGLDVDHKNQNGLDNRRDNLRHVTKAVNNLIRSKRADNKSGVVGVNWDSKCGKWRSQIQRDGVKMNLGFYDDFDDAVKARRDAECKYFN